MTEGKIMAKRYPACTPEQWGFIRQRAVACAALPLGGNLLGHWPGLCGVLKYPSDWANVPDTDPQTVCAAYYIIPKLFEKEIALPCGTPGVYFPGEGLTPLRLAVLETLILWIDAGIAQELYEQIRED